MLQRARPMVAAGQDRISRRMNLHSYKERYNFHTVDDIIIVTSCVTDLKKDEFELAMTVTICMPIVNSLMCLHS